MTTPKRRVEHNYLPQQFPFTTVKRNSKGHEPNITERILDRIEDIAGRGDFTIGKECGELESVWSKAVGTDFTISISNGTDAIAVALEAAGLEPGEEVITSPATFIATSGAIIQAGGKPVFVDVARPDAPNIIADTIPAAVLANAKWFVPVMWAGNPYGFDTWSRTTDCHVVVDAAQAVNARLDGKPLGAFANIDALCYSLHPLKNINVWGDGGMIATNQRGIDYTARLLRNHGLVGRDIWDRPGYNHRLSTVQAAVGLEVIKDIGFMHDQRQKNAAQLIEGIAGIDGITPPYIGEGQEHGYHLFQVLVEGNRNEFVEFMNERGVDSKTHYDVPLHLQPAMRALGHTEGEFPNAEHFAATHATLPVHEHVGSDDMDYMLETLRAYSEAGS